MTSSARSAPAAFSACMMAMMSRGLAPSAFSPRTTDSSVVPCFEHQQLIATLVDVDLFLRNHGGVAVFRKWRRLRHFQTCRNLHRQVAVRDGRRTQTNRAADHDGAGAFVDDDARHRVDVDRQRFDASQQLEEPSRGNSAAREWKWSRNPPGARNLRRARGSRPAKCGRR